MKILETQTVQRAYDGKWEQIGRYKDHENSYSFRNELGMRETIVPDKWITLKVFDFIVEIN